MGALCFISQTRCVTQLCEEQMLLILPMAKMLLRIYRCLQYKLPIFNFKAGHIERQIKCCWRKLLLQLAVNLGAQTVW